jgi:hypothetical protein
MSGVKRYERERLLSEQRGHGDTVRSAVERLALEHDLPDNALLGRPLRQRLRNAKPAAESYVVSLGGPMPYMQRLRAIEDETLEHELRLERAWRALADEAAGDERRFAERWRRTASRWSFFAVNALIEKHNRYYPIEARLPMDPRTGDFALVSGRPYHLQPLDEAWVLERFPADLALARGAEERAA